MNYCCLTNLQKRTEERLQKTEDDDFFCYSAMHDNNENNVLRLRELQTII